MDQILVSVCCPPQNEHIDNKNVANSPVGVTSKDVKNAPKFFLITFFCPGSFSGTAIDTSINNNIIIIKQRLTRHMSVTKEDESQ